MHTDSLYASTRRYAPQASQLHTRVQCDVTIIGSGMTGISAALELVERGYRVVVLEAQDLAWGASGRSGGQIIAGAGEDGASMLKLLGKEDARKAFDISLEAIELIRHRVSQYNIDCDLKSGQMEVAARPKHMAHLRQAAELMQNTFGYPVDVIDAQQTAEKTGSQAYYGAIFDPNGGHLHPMNYTLGMAQAAQRQGAQLFHHSPATDIHYGQKVLVKTPQGEVESDFLVLAANAYLNRLEPAISRYMMPVGSYICATPPLPGDILPADCAVFDSRHLFSYFRRDGEGRLLWGGRTGLTDQYPDNLEAIMRKRIAKVYPQLADVPFEKSWGGNVSTTLHRLPHFGRLRSNVYFAQGYSGHGVAMSGIGGATIARAIAGQAEQFDLLSRFPVKALPDNRLAHSAGLAAALIYFRIRDALG
ncbi:MAG: FAD-dependent oxidoreductase [Oceanospirillaceae bacterium]|nr:FAD-dependent oxidoreductase [Oceanospirillaceae bacterium]MBT10625.1 FAD-dependent oxidoreductase [Oceanospirillaceae bacterium]|tara:strand:+ start:37380 stop:38636 length:1257 start_codon:yes stop_codon:yes gene_type:complete